MLQILLLLQVLFPEALVQPVSNLHAAVLFELAIPDPPLPFIVVFKGFLPDFLLFLVPGRLQVDLHDLGISKA